MRALKVEKVNWKVAVGFVDAVHKKLENGLGGTNIVTVLLIVHCKW